MVVIRQPGQTPIHLQVREAIEVGRECTGLVLVDPKVSRRHLVLAPTHAGGPAEVAVLDLGSMNGTILEGRRITTEEVLHPGHELRLGDTTITLALDTVVAAPPARDPLPESLTATTVLPPTPDRTGADRTPESSFDADDSLWARRPVDGPGFADDDQADPW